VHKKMCVHRRVSVYVAMLRLSPVTNLELFEYQSPDQSRSLPNNDYGDHHLAFYVEDVDAAAPAYEHSSGPRWWGIERGSRKDPLCGRPWAYSSPWRTQIEVLCVPPGMSYEQQTTARRFGPRDAWINQ
jgi:hypothetical protein